MCTVTFIPQASGFLLGANRDERWERGHASTPPKLHSVGETRVICPRDVHGGTWIAVNEHGMAFTVLNRNHTGIAYSKQRSRGEVIGALLTARSLEHAKILLDPATLQGMLPFTLLSFSASESACKEQVWDGQALHERQPEWRAGHWFSSGLSDEKAKSERSRIAIEAGKEEDQGSTQWLRRFHRAHGPAPGPFSVCVHREYVGSVSYTEIAVNPSAVTMGYAAGSPCLASPLTEISLLRPATSH
jgi:transport and Golgi organization protein 2